MNKLLIAAALSFAVVSSAIAQQGAFPNYPIVGGAAYCASTTNGVCTSTVPAGPSSLTGNEQFPANTELSQGRSPQNVLVTPASLNANPLSFTSVVNPNTNQITATNVSGGTILISGGTISAAYLWLPPSPINGQQYNISATQSVTALNVFVSPGSGQSITNTPTAMTVSNVGSYGYSLVYDLGNLTWRRLQ